MPTSIRTSIVNNLVAALAAITVANGYLTTVKAVFRSIQDEDGRAKPIIELAIDPHRYTELSNISLVRVLPIKVIGSAERSAGGNPGLAGDELLADIEKAVRADRTRGGYAMDTKLVGGHVFDAEPQSPIVEVHLDIEITFRTRFGDPFTAA